MFEVAKSIPPLAPILPASTQAPLDWLLQWEPPPVGASLIITLLCLATLVPVIYIVTYSSKRKPGSGNRKLLRLSATLLGAGFVTHLPVALGVGDDSQMQHLLPLASHITATLAALTISFLLPRALAGQSLDWTSPHTDDPDLPPLAPAAGSRLGEEPGARTHPSPAWRNPAAPMPVGSSRLRGFTLWYQVPQKV